MIKLLASKLISSARYENLKINIKTLMNHPPILVYQMGKVGSSTVYYSLKSGIHNPIYHLHSLNKESLRNQEELCKSRNFSVYPEVKIGKILAQRIEKDKTKPWKIITLTREPISNRISHLFQNPRLFNPNLLNENGKIEESFAVEYILNTFKNFNESTDYIANWFDRELKQTFDINVYNYPFNYQKGFTIIRSNRADVLILKLEDLNQNFNQAMSEFLGIKFSGNLIDTNVRKNSRYSSVYKHVVKTIVIPKSLCEMIYSTKYATHFYSPQMRDELIRKWSRE